MTLKERTAWRERRFEENYRELAEISETHGVDQMVLLNKLLGRYTLDDPRGALQMNISGLTYEAFDCFIFGSFQATIMVCGGIVERVLKLERTSVMTLPEAQSWLDSHQHDTLGKLLKEDWTGTRIDSETLNWVSQVKSARDDRIHANMERQQPAEAALGGPLRGRDFRGNRYYIEPFRGDAKGSVMATVKILDRLYHNSCLAADRTACRQTGSPAGVAGLVAGGGGQGGA